MTILFDRFNLPDDIYEIIFATEQQALVAKLLVKEFKENNGEIGKGLMSMFATKLHEGKISVIRKEHEFMEKKEPVSYNKRQFYDRILTPMRAMGLIEYDLYKKVYRISDKFEVILKDIGKKWIIELRK